MENKELFELTNPQKSIWYTEQFYAGTTVNNICVSGTLYGQVDENILKQAINNQFTSLAYLVGAELVIDSDYPEWQYNPDSNLRTHFEKVYKDMFKKDSEVVAIHAGVECGLFKEKLPDLDMISIGPDMADVHTPNEHVSISSIQRTYSYLLEVLKRFDEIKK